MRNVLSVSLSGKIMDHSISTMPSPIPSPADTEILTFFFIINWQNIPTVGTNDLAKCPKLQLRKTLFLLYLVYLHSNERLFTLI